MEDMGAPQSGATYSKGNESGPACKAGTHREDMRAPLANRQSGYRYRNGNIWARPSRRDIYREEDMGAPKERHIGMGMPTLRYQSGTAYTMVGNIWCGGYDTVNAGRGGK